MADTEREHISSITLPNGETYYFKDNELTSAFSQMITNGKFNHKLTFGAGEVYVYDGSQDITVPVFTGTML
jgi:hypothetical protein